MRKLLISAGAFLFMSLSLTSCMPTADGPPQPRPGLLNLINASPKTADLLFFIGEQPIEMDYKEYKVRLYANPGTYKLKVTNKDRTKEFLSESVEITSQKYYSLVLADTLSKMNLVVLKDSIVSVSQDSVRVRFANMVPDVAKIDFYIEGETTPIAKDVNYKSAVEFIRMKKSPSVIIEAKASGTTEVLATSEAKELIGGSINTFFASGFKSLTDDGKIHVGVMRH